MLKMVFMSKFVTMEIIIHSVEKILLNVHTNNLSIVSNKILLITRNNVESNDYQNPLLNQH